jgi:8-oxo-dGTP diphosphatase
METEIIAAIIGGILALLGSSLALVPWLNAKMQERKVKANPNVFPTGEGLSAVIGIVQRGQEVLLVQRKNRISTLSWQFPAGIVKSGLDIRDKIESEVLNETGVMCQAQSYLGARVPGFTKVLCHYVHCLYLGGNAANLDPSENAQVVWVQVDKVTEYITSDIYVEVERLLEKIKSGSTLPKAVVGVVIQEGKVLLVKKKTSDDNSAWQFPGGAVEDKETEQKTTVREILEETGIQCTPIRKIGERIHPSSQVFLSYWLCAYRSGVIRLKEPDKFTDIAWVEVAKAPAFLGDDLFDPVKAVLENG